MNALVTSATSLLGSALVRTLAEGRHRVTAVAPSLAEAHRLFGDTDARCIAGAIADSHRWSDELDDIDAVFHAGNTASGVARMTGAPAVSSFETNALLAPGPIESTSLGQWILAVLERSAPPSKEGGVRIADARDVALAMIRAAERGAEGEFSVAGPYHSYDEIGRLLRGYPVSRFVNPSNWISPRAAQELGVRFRPLAETIADVLSWRARSTEASCRAIGALAGAR